MALSRKQAVIPTTHMNGHLAVELRTCGLPDLAHAALAQEGGDLEVADAGTDAQGHG